MKEKRKRMFDEVKEGGYKENKAKRVKLHLQVLEIQKLYNNMLEEAIIKNDITTLSNVFNMASKDEKIRLLITELLDNEEIKSSALEKASANNRPDIINFLFSSAKEEGLETQMFKQYGARAFLAAAILDTKESSKALCQYAKNTGRLKWYYNEILNINIRESELDEVCFLFSIVTSEERKELLLSRNLDVDGTEISLLEKAAKYNRPDVINFLMCSKDTIAVAPKMFGKYAINAFFMAAYFGHKAPSEILCQQARGFGIAKEYYNKITDHSINLKRIDTWVFLFNTVTQEEQRGIFDYYKTKGAEDMFYCYIINNFIKGGDITTLTKLFELTSKKEKLKLLTTKHNDKKGVPHSAIEIAAENDQAEMISFLLSHSDDVDHETFKSNLQDAFFKAVCAGNKSSLEILCQQARDFGVATEYYNKITDYSISLKRLDTWFFLFNNVAKEERKGLLDYYRTKGAEDILYCYILNNFINDGGIPTLTKLFELTSKEEKLKLLTTKHNDKTGGSYSAIEIAAKNDQSKVISFLFRYSKDVDHDTFKTYLKDAFSEAVCAGNRSSLEILWHLTPLFDSELRKTYLMKDDYGAFVNAAEGFHINALKALLGFAKVLNIKHMKIERAREEVFPKKEESSYPNDYNGEPDNPCNCLTGLCDSDAASDY